VLTKATQLSGPLLAVLLLFPTLAMAAAPYNSWAARRAQLPAWLRDRRRTEYRRDRHTFAAGMAAGGVVGVLGVAIAAVALLFTGHHAVQTPNLVGPAQGTHAATAATATATAATAATATATARSPGGSSPSTAPSSLRRSRTVTPRPRPPLAPHPRPPADLDLPSGQHVRTLELA
jgi:hypothetical protein